LRHAFVLFNHSVESLRYLPRLFLQCATCEEGYLGPKDAPIHIRATLPLLRLGVAGSKDQKQVLPSLTDVSGCLIHPVEKPGLLITTMDSSLVPSKYVTLVSADGFEFVVLREAAMVSPIIKSMLDLKSQFAEAKDARCVFQEIK
jgi:hypothetical protein